MQNFFSPKETMSNYLEGSEKRIQNDSFKIILLAVFAGMFIAFGAGGSSLAVHNIAEAGIARLVAGLVFPVGLMMVILTGAELFTGDCMFIMGACQKRYKMLTMIKVLVLVYFGNMIGGVLIAILTSFSGQFDYTAGLLGAYTIKIAAGKVALPFYKALISGILCNILVCVAVFMAGCAKDIVGKLFAVFFPILLFVVCGFEHCVANMYYIPAGIMARANEQYAAVAMEQYGLTMEQISNISWSNFFIHNLVPVTLGNIIGGMLAFAIPVLLIYGESKGGSFNELFKFSRLRGSNLSD